MARISQYSHAQLTEYLEAMIASGKFQSGSKLPSLRELSTQFNLNLDTVRRGIWALRDKGLVECRRNTGVFVAARRQKNDGEYRVAVYLENANMKESFTAHVFWGIQEEAARKNVTLELHTRYHVSRPEQLADDMAQQLQKCDAAILLGSYDRSLAELPRSCPVVGVEMHRTYRDLASVLSLDPVRAAELAADYFRERGHDKVIVLSESFPLHQFRAELFVSQWCAGGGMAERRELLLLPENEPDFEEDCGYLFTGGQICNWACARYAEKSGTALAATRTLLSIDGKSRLIPGFVPVSTIDIDWMLAGKLALHEALRRILEPGVPAQRIYIAPDLHVI